MVETLKVPRSIGACCLLCIEQPLLSTGTDHPKAAHHKASDLPSHSLPLYDVLLPLNHRPCLSSAVAAWTFTALASNVGRASPSQQLPVPPASPPQVQTLDGRLASLCW